jgi:hypothetical protein
MSMVLNLKVGTTGRALARTRPYEAGFGFVKYPIDNFPQIRQFFSHGQTGDPALVPDGSSLTANKSSTEFVRFHLQNNDKVPDNGRRELRIPIYDKTRTPHPAPDSVPETEVETPHPRTLRIKFRHENAPRRKFLNRPSCGPVSPAKQAYTTCAILFRPIFWKTGGTYATSRNFLATIRSKRPSATHTLPSAALSASAVRSTRPKFWRISQKNAKALDVFFTFVYTVE